MSQTLFTAKVTSVESYSFVAEGKLKPTTVFKLTFDKKFDAVVKDENGEFVKTTDCNQLSYTRSALIANLHSALEMFDYVYSIIEEQIKRDEKAVGFSLPQAMMLLKGAEVTIDRTPFKEGEEYTLEDGTVASYSHDGYRSDIVNVKPTAMGSSWMMKQMDKI